MSRLIQLYCQRTIGCNQQGPCWCHCTKFELSKRMKSSVITYYFSDVISCPFQRLVQTKSPEIFKIVFGIMHTLIFHWRVGIVTPMPVGPNWKSRVLQPLISAYTGMRKNIYFNSIWEVVVEDGHHHKITYCDIQCLFHRWGRGSPQDCQLCWKCRWGTGWLHWSRHLPWGWRCHQKQSQLWWQLCLARQ